MDRWIYRLVWVGGILFLILIIAVGSITYYINRPAFKTRVEKMASKSVKMPVKFDSLKIRWDGIRLKNLTLPYIDNKSQTPFVYVKDLSLSFSLQRLLKGELVLDAIILNAPRIILQEFSNGKIELPENSKEDLESKEKMEVSDLPQTEEASLKTKVPKHKRFSIDEVEIEDGLFQFLDNEQKAKVRCEGIQASGSFFTAAKQLQSQGQIRIQSIVIDPHIELTAFKTPIFYTNKILLLPNFNADLYEGKISGRFRAHFDKEQKPFQSKIEVRDFDLKTFLETRSEETSPIEGKADLNFEGQSTLEEAANIAGKGDFLVKSFNAKGLKFFREIGNLIGVPGLSDIGFDEIMGNFSIKNQQVMFEKIETHPKKSTTYMVGEGMIDFNGNLNFDGAITLNSSLIGGLSQLLKTVKIKSKDGMITIPFKVTGTTEDPKIQVISVDLAKETMKGVLDLVPLLKF